MDSRRERNEPPTCHDIVGGAILVLVLVLIMWAALRCTFMALALRQLCTGHLTAEAALERAIGPMACVMLASA